MYNAPIRATNSMSSHVNKIVQIDKVMDDHHYSAVLDDDVLGKLRDKSMFYLHCSIFIMEINATCSPRCMIV